MTTRSPEAVFDAHLRLRAAGDLEADLRENYANDVVLLCSYGVFQGVEAVRQSADRLGLQLPGAHFDYVTRVTHGEYALLEWKATSDRFRVSDGADSFVIRNGRIQMQTIHYTLLPPDEETPDHPIGARLMGAPLEPLGYPIGVGTCPRASRSR